MLYFMFVTLRDCSIYFSINIKSAITILLFCYSTFNIYYIFIYIISDLVYNCKDLLKDILIKK